MFFPPKMDVEFDLTCALCKKFVVNTFGYCGCVCKIDSPES